MGPFPQLGHHYSQAEWYLLSEPDSLVLILAPALPGCVTSGASWNVSCAQLSHLCSREGNLLSVTYMDGPKVTGWHVVSAQGVLARISVTGLLTEQRPHPPPLC